MYLISLPYADVNVQDYHGYTPLMYASERSTYDPDYYIVIKSLINAGAKLDTKNNSGKTAFDLCDNMQICEDLLSQTQQDHNFSDDHLDDEIKIKPKSKPKPKRGRSDEDVSSEEKKTDKEKQEDKLQEKINHS